MPELTSDPVYDVLNVTFRNGATAELWIDEAHGLAKLLNEELARREAETARVLDLIGRDACRCFDPDACRCFGDRKPGEGRPLERQARDGGSLFDLHKDTVKDIADLIVRECTPSRVESLIRELRTAQKRRSAHAG